MKKEQNFDFAQCALLIGNYYGKRMGIELKKTKLPFFMNKTKKVQGLSNACLCFLKEFIPEVFRPIFENTNTKILMDVVTDRFPQTGVHIGFQTKKREKFVPTYGGHPRNNIKYK